MGQTTTVAQVFRYSSKARWRRTGEGMQIQFPLPAMRLQRVAFRRGNVRYRFADALLLAALGDEWAVVEAALRAGVAAAASAPSASLPADGDIAAAVREFRYEH